MSIEGFRKNLLLFLFIWLIVGLLSVIFFKYPYYDWYNYHHYNSWAYFNNRYDTDFLAANYRTYFIPYVDLLPYILFEKLTNHPALFLFLESFDTAFVITLTYKIGDLVLSDSLKEKKFLIFYNFAFVIFSPIFLLLSGFSMNDMRVAIFILFGVYILINNLFSRNSNGRLRNIFISGAFTGVALALKLTSVVYFLTVTLILLIMFKRIEKPFKTIGLYISGCILSFLIISGHWYYTMYKHFGNPFAPYFNGIFKSPYFIPDNFVALDFDHVKAQSIPELLFYPFYAINNHSLGNSEGSFDPRYMLMFFSVLVLIPSMVSFEKLKKDNIFAQLIKPNYLWFLIYFISVSFYLNFFIFGTNRYIISSALLFGFILIACIYSVFSNFKYKNIWISITLVLLLLTTTCFTDYGSSKYRLFKDFLNIPPIFQIQGASIEPGAYVFVLGAVSSYVIPYLNPSAKYMLITVPPDYESKNDVYNAVKESMNLKFITNNMHTKFLAEKIHSIMQSESRVYLLGLFADDDSEAFSGLLKYYSGRDIKSKKCSKINLFIFDKYRYVNICEFGIGSKLK